jgi:hypothetical protein
MTRFVRVAVLYWEQEDMMKNEQMSLFPLRDLGQAIMTARDLILVASDYVAQWGEGCLGDPETPAFIRSIYSDQGLHAVQKAG